MDATVIVAIIIAIVVIVVVILLKDRLLELSVNGKEVKMEAKMEARAKAQEAQDDKPVSVVFKGNKLRGEGEYRMRSADFSENDVDGKQRLELGYDEPSSDVQGEENK
jgi:predicted Holliday junction resolvase-like endonuclease